jgi:hypothetical protein
MISTFSLIGYALFAAQRFGVRVEYALFNAACGVITVLFLAGVAGALAPVAWLLWAGGFVCGALGVVRAVRLKNAQPFTPGLLMFAAACVSLYVLTRGGAFASWDEFSHWGTIIKHISSVSSLYQGHTLKFQDYPPGLALFSYFMFLPLGFSEPNAFFASGVLALSAGAVLAARAGWFGSAAAFAIFYLMSFIFGIGLATVLIDFVMGAVFGAALCLYAQEAPLSVRRAAALCALPLFALVLLKAAGVLLALTVVLLVFIDAAFRGADRRELAISIGLLAGAIVAPILLWKLVMAWSGYPSRTSEFSLMHPLRVLVLGQHDPNGLVIWSRFKEAIAGDFVFARTGVRFPAIAGTVTTALLCGAIAGTRRLAAAAVVILGGLFYLYGLLATYFTNMSFYEAKQLASFDRYLLVYMAAMAMLGFVWVRNAKYRLVSVVGVACFLAVAATAARGAAATFLKSGSPAMSAVRVDAVARVRPLWSDDMRFKRTYIVWQNTNGYPYWLVRYEVLPAPVNSRCWAVALKASDDIYMCPRSVAQFAKDLAQYDLLLVASADETFFRSYAELFETPPAVDRPALFEIDRGNGQVRLRQIKSSGTSDSLASGQSPN